MRAWQRYVRAAARILGRRPSVKALTITNEGNFTATPNTSDGGYRGVRAAIVAGITAARDELDQIGHPDVELGFSFAWRWLPNSDAAFWRELGARSTPRFVRALDYVGLQIYPQLIWPPLPLPGRSAGEEMIEALTLLRRCYMPKAGLGDEVDLWVTENGYATNLARTERGQLVALRSTLDQVHRYSGTLGSATTAGSISATTAPAGSTCSTRSGCSATTTPRSPRSGRCAPRSRRSVPAGSRAQPFLKTL